MAAAGVIQQHGVKEELVVVAAAAGLDGADVGRSGGGRVVLLLSAAASGLGGAGIMLAPFVVHLAHDPFILNTIYKIKPEQKKRHTVLVFNTIDQVIKQEELSCCYLGVEA